MVPTFRLATLYVKFGTNLYQTQGLYIFPTCSPKPFDRTLKKLTIADQIPLPAKASHRKINAIQ
jgi:hypothetical protein